MQSLGLFVSICGNRFVFFDRDALRPSRRLRLTLGRTYWLRHVRTQARRTEVQSDAGFRFLPGLSALLWDSHLPTACFCPSNGRSNQRREICSGFIDSSPKRNVPRENNVLLGCEIFRGSSHQKGDEASKNVRAAQPWRFHSRMGGGSTLNFKGSTPRAHCDPVENTSRHFGLDHPLFCWFVFQCVW